MFLIGSGAMAKSSIPWRAPKDFDYIATDFEFRNFCELNKKKITSTKQKRRGYIAFKGNTPYEFEICGLFQSANLLYDYMRVLKLEYATPDIVLMMKMSHRYLKNSPHFIKTMKDIRALREAGVILPAFAKEWLSIREKETYDYHHPKLNQTKIDFFKDDFYIYDHDTIHLAVKLYDKPAYDYFKPDTNEVNISKKLFNEASDDIKLASVYEESCVLALERHQIPNSLKPNPKISFGIALEKVCTSITSGWWREYAYDHYFDVVELYEKLGYNKYVNDFLKAKRDGILKPHIGKNNGKEA